MEDRREKSTSSRHHSGGSSRSHSERASATASSSGSYRTVVDSRDKEKRSERSRSDYGTRKSRSTKREDRRKDKKRSRSRSSDSSFEGDFGVKKETFLHGSYADYLKEYSAKGGNAKGNGPTMADLAAAYQKALTQVASALEQQGSRSGKVDSKNYSKRVDDFLAKAHGK